MEYMIETRQIHKSFPLGNKETLEVLKGIDLKIEKGKLTILKGRSGSGKTTLLNILSLLDAPTKGELLIDGEEMKEKSEVEKEKIRRYHIGFVFQSVALLPILSAYENVEFGMRLAAYEGNMDERIRNVLRIVGLQKRMGHMPAQMSGGEQQRVAIARAVAHSPKIIFADEPTGALDTDSGLAIMKLFRELIEKEGITIVMTTHDPNLMQLGDVVYEMEDGELTLIAEENEAEPIEETLSETATEEKTEKRETVNKETDATEKETDNGAEEGRDSGL